MKPEPSLEVWQFTEGGWTWRCWSVRCNFAEDGGDYPTHAEALAAALAHCKEKAS